MNTARLTLAFLSTSLALASQVAHADIQIGDATSASAAAGTNLPELVLMVWDPVAKVFGDEFGPEVFARITEAQIEELRFEFSTTFESPEISTDQIRTAVEAIRGRWSSDDP